MASIVKVVAGELAFVLLVRLADPPRLTPDAFGRPSMRTLAVDNLSQHERGVVKFIVRELVARLDCPALAQTSDAFLLLRALRTVDTVRFDNVQDAVSALGHVLA